MSTVGGGDIIQANDHNDHETRLNAIEGRFTTTTGTSAMAATSGTTELAGDQVTKTLVAGERYRIKWILAWGGTVNGDIFQIKIRLGSGIAGTQLQLQSVPIGSQFATIIETEYTAPSSGPQTFTGTVQRNSGTGTMTVAGSSTIPRFLSCELIT